VWEAEEEPMPTEPSESAAVIRAAYAHYARGDVEQMLELVDPDLEWTYLDPGLPDPEPQTCHGRGELAMALQRQAEQGLTSRLEDVRANGEQVMAVIHTPGVDGYRLRSAGDRNYDVFTVRDGRIVAIRACHDRTEALAIAGIS
jgi:ketosteroid isomerase-like protein